jgi:hypothetical protein
MDLVVVLIPVLISNVAALSRSETIRWLLYLVFCWLPARKHGPEALKNAAVMARAVVSAIPGKKLVLFSPAAMLAYF